MAKKVIGYIKTGVVGIVFLFYMFPFLLVLVNSFKRKVNIVKYPLQLIDDKGIQWVNYKNALEEMDFLRSFSNSLIITFLSVILLILFSAMAAYIFVRTDWKICKVSFFAMMASMVIPFQVIMIPLVYIYGGKLGYSIQE